MLKLLRKLVKKDRAQDLIEYAVLAGFISLAGVFAITSVGSSVTGAFDDIAQVLQVGGSGSGDDDDDDD